MGAPDSSASDNSVPEVKVEIPPMHAAAGDHAALASDGKTAAAADKSSMKRVQSNVGDGLRITFKARLLRHGCTCTASSILGHRT